MDKKTPFVRIKKRRKKGGAPALKLSHDDVSKAVEEFLNRGGKIQRIEAAKRTYSDIIATHDPISEVDQFLMGN